MQSWSLWSKSIGSLFWMRVGLYQEKTLAGSKEVGEEWGCCSRSPGFLLAKTLWVSCAPTKGHGSCQAARSFQPSCVGSGDSPSLDLTGPEGVSLPAAASPGVRHYLKSCCKTCPHVLKSSLCYCLFKLLASSRRLPLPTGNLTQACLFGCSHERPGHRDPTPSTTYSPCAGSDLVKLATASLHLTQGWKINNLFEISPHSQELKCSYAT